MGLLTNRRGSEGFAIFETALGLALVLSAALYLQRIDRLNSKVNCDEILNQNQTEVKVEAVTAEFTLCSNLAILRVMAFLGIATGSLLVLILPFLCCCVLCAACGACLFFCLCLGNDLYSDQNRAREDSNADAEFDLGRRKKENKYDLHNMPKPVRCWTNLVGWILWLIFPLVSTGLIGISLYKYDALRTDNDSLYNSGLAFFVISLLNFSLFFQKIMTQMCGQVRAVALNDKKKIKRENTLARLHRIHKNRQRVGEEEELKSGESGPEEDEESQLKNGETPKSETVNEKAAQAETVQEK